MKYQRPMVSATSDISCSFRFVFSGSSNLPVYSIQVTYPKMPANIAYQATSCILTEGARTNHDRAGRARTSAR